MHLKSSPKHIMKNHGKHNDLMSKCSGLADQLCKLTFAPKLQHSCYCVTDLSKCFQ